MIICTVFNLYGIIDHLKICLLTLNKFNIFDFITLTGEFKCVVLFENFPVNFIHLSAEWELRHYT